MRTFDYSKLAQKTWDMEIITYLSKIYERKGRQNLFVRQKPVELTRMVEIAKIQSTEASNKIEGIVTTSTRMRQLVEEKTTPRNRDESEIMGYRDVLNTIHESHDFIPLKPSYILQLHRDLMKRAGLSYGGHFKNVQNSINETRPDGTQVTRFTPVAPYETEAAIEAICDSYKRTLAMENVDPLILIPAFICDFLCIHPFNDGNGRMSRLLTLLLLYQNGYEVGKYISIEKKIESTKGLYYDVLEKANYGWHEEKNDPTPFIRYMLKVILACYTEFEERVGIVEKTGVRSSAYDVVKAYISGKIGKFTSAEVIVSCPSVGRSAILSALKRLVEEKEILKIGTGRATCYVRTESTDDDYISTPIEYSNH
ncbi:MAG: Fic family protein [Lachnospiraceae bacterium]|nr:Fic family protein [Lachnospiraceae bacterium]